MTAREASGVSDDVIQRMAAEPPLREYLVTKYDKEAQRNWDLFYKRNTTNFFKVSARAQCVCVRAVKACLRFGHLEATTFFLQRYTS